MEPSHVVPSHTLPAGDDSGASGTSWSAVFAGAAATAALSYVLVILGFGLGLSAVTPWNGSGATVAAAGAATVAWLTFTQIASSGVGGYLAGRLRVKWTRVHTDEVYFRDTAHGFLSWCVASLVVAAFLATALGNALGAGATAAGSAVGGVTAAAGSIASKAAEQADANGGYFVDALLRTDPSKETANANRADDAAQVGRILTRSIANGNLSDDDKRYLSQLVAARTGVTPEEADRRIASTFDAMKKAADTAIAKAREVADQARKTAVGLSLWMVMSLFCGAFAASWAATFGGRRRDAFPRAS